jgi:hypothetical protein
MNFGDRMAAEIPARAYDGVPISTPRRRRLDPDAPAVENIARVIGAGATARLISAFGGGRLYIAKHPHAADPLARVIGSEAAGRLGKVFGGERIWFPNDAGHRTRQRIALLRQRGSSVARIARELRLSERYVYKVLAQLRDACR